ncbi:MAG: PaaI family thioesterase [bacterium]
MSATPQMAVYRQPLHGKDESVDHAALKPVIEGTIPWVRDSGLQAELLEERHVLLRLPKDRHLNHVGIVYAGSLFMLMEVSGAALFGCTYAPGKYIPINREMSIRFLRMGVTDITCELSLAEERAAEMIRPIDEKGKGEWVLEMDCRDTEGNVIATSVCHYYIKKIE